MLLPFTTISRHGTRRFNGFIHAAFLFRQSRLSFLSIERWFSLRTASIFSWTLFTIILRHLLTLWHRLVFLELLLLRTILILLHSLLSATYTTLHRTLWASIADSIRYCFPSRTCSFYAKSTLLARAIVNTTLI